MITVSDNLDALSRILAEYQMVSGKTTREVLVKNGTDLAIQMGEELKKLAPPKGSVTASRIQAMKQGGGIKVRKSIIAKMLRREVTNRGGFVRIADKEKHIKDKKGISGIRFAKANDENWVDEEGETKNAKGQSLWNLIVARELSTRESGSGYTAYAARIGVKELIAKSTVLRLGRKQQEIGRATITESPDNGALTMSWGGLGPTGEPIGSGQSLSKPRQQAAIMVAIQGVIADTGLYLARKHAQGIRDSASKAITLTPMRRR